jgi:glycosyltransferase involved in cell wall biosynthesis
MKPVLFISVMNGSAWGGSEEIWFQSVLWLAQRNYPVGVCCFNWPGKQDKLQQLKQAGCKLYLLPGKNETKSIFGKWKLTKAVKVIPFSGYHTVIVNQGGWKDVVHGPFKKLYKRLPRYALTFHNYNAKEKLPGGKRNLLSNWIHNSYANLAATERVFSTLKESYSLNAPNQAIVINPITFAPPESITPFATAHETKSIFCMLAALDTNRKAQDLLIKTLGQSKWKERNWELNLYGEGNDKVILEKAIIEQQLQSKIFLKGYTKDIKKVLAESHLLLQITHRDAMPLSVMEAMAMSRPVVISDVGDMALWVKQGANGWITPEVTVECINETLEIAWVNRHRWEEMGKKSFAIFKEKYPADPAKYFLKQTSILGDERVS